MLRLTPTYALLPLALGALAAPATADRLDPAVVDARARAVVHVDVQALKATEFFRLLRAEAGEKLDAAMADFAAQTGLNPLEDLRGVTAYALDVSEDRWVALLHTTARIDAALEELRKRPGYSETRIGEKTIHSFADGDEHWYGHLFRAREGEERLFALADDSNALLEAIGVVEGARPGLDDTAEPLVASQPTQGAVLFVSAATDLSDLVGFDPDGQVARLLRGVLVECCETQGTFYTLVRLSTGSHDDALKVEQVIQGGLALASLIAGRADEAQKLTDYINALEVDRQGTVVTLTFRYASKELFAGLRGILDEVQVIEQR